MNQSNDRPSTLAGNPQFPATRWSSWIGPIQDGTSSPEACAAFEVVCKAYWYPLYAYLRRKGKRPDDAADLTQGFFAHLAEKRTLLRGDQARGRLRNFMIGSLKNFVRECERKRSGDMIDGNRVVSLDDVISEGESRYVHEPADVQDPEKIFQRRWALTILEQVHTGLAAEWAGKGRRRVFERLQVYLIEKTTEESYAEVGIELGMTEGAVGTEVSRMRAAWGTRFREEIFRTVGTAWDVDDEIQHVFSVLQG